MKNENDYMIGQFHSYYNSGQIKEFHTCDNGNKVGDYIEFHENGQKKTFGTYVLIDVPHDHIKTTSDTVIDAATGRISILTTEEEIYHDKKMLCDIIGMIKAT